MKLLIAVIFSSIMLTACGSADTGRSEVAADSVISQVSTPENSTVPQLTPSPAVPQPTATPSPPGDPAPDVQACLTTLVFLFGSHNHALGDELRGVGDVMEVAGVKRTKGITISDRQMVADLIVEQCADVLDGELLAELEARVG